MTVELEENVHRIYDWHRVAEVLPLLNHVFKGMSEAIDREMMTANPGEPDYEILAVAAWSERRAIEKVRKSLTQIVKRGKTASKTIAPDM